MTVSRSAKSPFSLPKPAISVGQTKVKSLGQKKTSFHLPLSLSWVKAWKALAALVDTTPWTEKSGNLSPTVSMSTPWNYSNCETLLEVFQKSVKHQKAGLRRLSGGN